MEAIGFIMVFILGMYLQWRDDQLYREPTLEEVLRSLDDE